MAISRITSARGYVGIPALIFIEFTNYNRGTQGYLEKRTILHKIYSYLRGYLPVVYEKKPEDYYQNIQPRMDDLANRLAEVRDKYKPNFESIENYDPDEAEFDELLDGVFEGLAEVAAISKVIDKEKPDDGEVFAG